MQIAKCVTQYLNMFGALSNAFLLNGSCMPWLDSASQIALYQLFGCSVPHKDTHVIQSLCFFFCRKKQQSKKEKKITRRLKRTLFSVSLVFPHRILRNGFVSPVCWFAMQEKWSQTHKTSGWCSLSLSLSATRSNILFFSTFNFTH